MAKASGMTNTRNFLEKEGASDFSPRGSTKEQLISAIVNSVKDIIAEHHLSKSDILGVGLGLPGPIDVERGLVHFFPNIPGWKEVRLKNILIQKLG